MKPCYVLYVCPTCETPSLFAGFCDLCDDHARLERVMVMPMPHIRRICTETVAKASEVPAYFVKQFTDRLMESCSAPANESAPDSLS